MKLNRIKTAALLVLAFLLLGGFFLPEDDLTNLVKKFAFYHKMYHQEKIYIHLDKPLYAAGEDLWFKAYLLNASFHTPDSVSRVIYVELIDSDKKIVKREV